MDVLHFGGNGHNASRIGPARAALDRPAGGESIRLVDVPYPGFEGRPRARSLDDFFGAVADAIATGPKSPRAAYASGIGALIALGVRARGGLAEVPLLFQGPVLWGLEQRTFPRLMRWKLPRMMLAGAFRTAPFRRHFARTQFVRPPDPAFLDRFFDGYARCAAFDDFFLWFTPDFLRDLELRFAEDPGATGDVRVWLGGRDRVVGAAEVEATGRALGVRWPVEVFPDWGHYPMIDAPEEWARALRDALATPA